MDAQTLQQLKKIYKETEKLEDILLLKIPHAFIDIQSIPKEFHEKIFSNHSARIASKLDFQDKSVVLAISNYVKVAENILSQSSQELETRYDFATPLEKKLIYAQNIIQKTRYYLFKPQVASFQLEKILSQKEREFWGTEELQPENMPITEFNLYEYLLKNALGEFDMEATLKKETIEGNIKSFLSSINSISVLKNYLETRFKTDSNFIPFALINPEITEIICEIAAEEIIDVVVRYAYKLIEEGLTDANALDLIRKKLYSVALEYLKNGDSVNDKIKLGERIYSKVMNVLSGEFGTKNKISQSVALETLRLSVEAITYWTSMPENFYKINLREASEEEKISEEVSHVLEVRKHDSNSELDFFEMYAISFPPVVKNTLHTLSTKGIQNPEYIVEYLKNK